MLDISSGVLVQDELVELGRHVVEGLLDVYKNRHVFVELDYVAFGQHLGLYCLDHVHPELMPGDLLSLEKEVGAAGFLCLRVF